MPLWVAIASTFSSFPFVLCTIKVHNKKVFDKSAKRRWFRKQFKCVGKWFSVFHHLTLTFSLLFFLLPPLLFSFANDECRPPFQADALFFTTILYRFSVFFLLFVSADEESFRDEERICWQRKIVDFFRLSINALFFLSSECYHPN